MASISRIITFVPTIGGNDKKPEAEQFAVKLKAVKVERKQEQLRRFVEMDPKKLMEEMMSQKKQNEIVALLNEHFVRFVNFDVDDEAEATAEDEVANKKGMVEGVEVSLTKGTIYSFSRPAVMADIFELGEFELAMEIFMHMIGSSQLRRAPDKKKIGGGGGEELTAEEDREDEEKNSESLSGTTPTPRVM